MNSLRYIALFALILLAGCSGDTETTYLRNLVEKDSAGVMTYDGSEIVTDQTEITKAWLESVIGQNIVNLTNALIQRGYSASDAASLTAALEMVADSLRSGLLIIPKGYSADSTYSLSASDSGMAVLDLRGVPVWDGVLGLKTGQGVPVSALANGVRLYAKQNGAYHTLAIKQSDGTEVMLLRNGEHLLHSVEDYGGDFSAALDSADANNTMLYIHKTYTITASAPDTLKSTAAIYVQQGGGFTPTRQFVIQGNFNAGNYQVFFGANKDSVEFAAGAVENVLTEWFGSVGDSSTDDYAAFQAAANSISSAGGTIKILNRHYLLKSNWKPSSNTIIEGQGLKSVIDFYDDGTSASRTLWLDNVDNVTIRGLKLKSSNATSRSAVYGLIRADSSDHVKVENVVFEKSPSTAIWTEYCQDWEVRGCTILETYADGFHFSRESRDIKVVNNWVYNTGDDGASSVGYIDGAKQRGPCKNILYQGNHFQNIAGRAMLFQGVKGGIAVDNFIQNTTQSGILLGGTSAGDSTRYNLDITVADNKIRNTGTGLSSSQSGIYISYVNGFTVDGNRIDSTEGVGITVSFVSLNGSINDNEISNGDRGIIITQTSTSHYRVIDELFDAVGDTGRTTVGIENITIAGNKIYRQEIDGIYVAGEASLYAQNIVLDKNILWDNNTTNSGSVRNLFFYRTNIGKMSHNVCLPGANGYSITNYADASSTEITYSDNYPALAAADSSVRGRLFNGADTVAVSATNTWYILDGTSGALTNNMTATNDSLVVAYSGVFEITVTATFASLNTGDNLEIGIGIDGASPGDDAKVRENNVAANEFRSASIAITKSLNSGDSIYMMARNLSTTNNIRILNATLVATKINYDSLDN